MSKEKFAFDKTNFILLGIGMAVVIIGFLSDYFSDADNADDTDF